MKRMVLAGMGVLAVVSMLGAAHAADLPRRRAMPTKAPAYAPAFYNWTGVYAGINGGGGFGHSDWNLPAGTSGFDLSGGLVGGTFGYNYQMNRVVLGLEGDIDWSNIKGDTTAGTNICAGISCETRNQWLATARGRIGYAFDRVLPYITGGGAFGDVKMTPAGVGSETDTRAGWTVGAGVEAALAGHWTAKVEYLYVDLGKANCSAATCGASTEVSFDTNVVRAGLNYRF
ncbi:MAG: porin family protein [Pseudolabrys sp.]|jgi:outer membrane immunogenic protein